MKEELRQIKMAWQRGRDFGLVCGIVLNIPLLIIIIILISNSN